MNAAVGTRALSLALTLLIVLASVVPVAHASALAGGGLVITDFGRAIDRAEGVAIQPDGKIVVAGGSGHLFAVARYNSDGSLDDGFGIGGKITTPVGGTGGAPSSIAPGVAIQRDGRILVAGSQVRINIRIGTFVLVRYNADGSLDPGFGTGGIVKTGFNISGDPISRAHDLAIMNDGRIIAVGVSHSRVFALARYNPDSSLDAGFDQDGRVTTEFPSFFATAYAMVVQNDGRIVAAGEVVAAGGLSPDFALARYNLDGSLDAGFGQGGRVTTDFAGGTDRGRAAVGQPDGRIVVAGFSLAPGPEDVELVRYNPDGSLDTTFGRDGKVITDFANTQDQANGVALSSGGKIVIVGRAGDDFALARYNPDGSLDATFGRDGKVTTDFANSFDSAAALAIQRDGRIVVVGRTDDPTSGGINFALARYNPDGSLDPTFGR